MASSEIDSLQNRQGAIKHILKQAEVDAGTRIAPKGEGAPGCKST